MIREGWLATAFPQVLLNLLSLKINFTFHDLH